MTPQPIKKRRIQIIDTIGPDGTSSADIGIDHTTPPTDLGMTGDDILYLRNLIRRYGREQVEGVMNTLLHEDD